ncbi:hypothetical protein [Thiohalomonas denitrificans]|uniref:hypothetical protein n=1 Tax=Thiohalomonas denitrificans TaxID=415747 RepID=UPI001586E60F|nr:hypothetical protein [Thiohalomonas denitrificans]
MNAGFAGRFIHHGFGAIFGVEQGFYGFVALFGDFPLLFGEGGQIGCLGQGLRLIGSTRRQFRNRNRALFAGLDLQGQNGRQVNGTKNTVILPPVADLATGF